MPAPLTCHAEAAAHAAACLRRDTECGALLIGNVHRLHIAAATSCKEILDSAVGASGLGERLLTPYRIPFFHKCSAGTLGQVGHRVDVAYTLLIQPYSHLPGRKRAQTYLGGYVAKLRKC